MALVEATVGNLAIAGEEKRVRSSSLQVKNVLLATDFSAASEAALPYAAAICRHFHSTLHLAHVLSDAGLLMMTGGVDYVSMGTIYEDAHSEAKEKLGELSSRLAGIPTRTYVRHGQVWKNLEGILEDNEIDLVVLGTHGRSGLGKLLLGSVAESILRHAFCPVLTIGPKVSGRARLPAFCGTSRDVAPLELELRQIVFATNFSNSADRAAQEAVSLAEEFQSRLTLMHVVEDYTLLNRSPRPMADVERNRLRALVPRTDGLQHLPETIIEFGAPGPEILKVACEREADMIILGARPAAEVGSTHFPWTAAHDVIAAAPCPVLTIRE
jgi:nucleotide-binding universal stress UspA family protein